MDKAVERKNRDKVLRQVARLLAERGFRRTRSTFFTRERGSVVEFVHLHKYSFDADFRVHLGTRAAGDPSDVWALNGPDSHPYACKDSPSGRRFNFRFHEASETVERCAGEIADFVREVAEPWFRGGAA